MASGRRVLLTGGVAVLLVVGAVTAVVVQRGDGDGGARSVDGTSTPVPGSVDAAGSERLLTPSNALGAPVVAPEPSARQADGPGDPSTTAWWRRVPPVAGTLTASDGRSIGTVTILGTDGDTLTITVAGDPALPAGATRAVLTSPDGREEDLGVVTPDMRGVAFVLGATSAERLPDPVHALELRGPGGRVVASGVLLPV